MPYIDKAARLDFKRRHWPQPVTPGELAYVVAVICWEWLGRQEQPGWSERADVIKALDAVTDEWRRHVVRPYEDGKIRDNGGVFTYGDDVAGS